MTADVRNNEDQSRYELWLDGRMVGVADYELVDDTGDELLFPHVEIERALRNQGLGDQLIQGALDDVRRAGRMLVPRCWAVADYITEHPEYADLVVRETR
jgi:predicted GNAT family acetyltransferase